MVLHHKNKKTNKKFVSGKGLCNATKKHYIIGKGLMDIPIQLVKNLLPSIIGFAKNKDLAKNMGSFAVNTIKDSVNLANNVKEIKKQNEIGNIVNKIKQLEIKGAGFNII